MSMEAGLSGLLGRTAQELVVWTDSKTECETAPIPYHSMRASSAKGKIKIKGFARQGKNAKVILLMQIPRSASYTSSIWKLQ